MILRVICTHTWFEICLMTSVFKYKNFVFPIFGVQVHILSVFFFGFKHLFYGVRQRPI